MTWVLCEPYDAVLVSQDTCGPSSCPQLSDLFLVSSNSPSVLYAAGRRRWRASERAGSASVTSPAPQNSASSPLCQEAHAVLRPERRPPPKRSRTHFLSWHLRPDSINIVQDEVSLEVVWDVSLTFISSDCSVQSLHSGFLNLFSSRRRSDLFTYASPNTVSFK